MKCDQAIRLVEKLADGEANAREKSQAESHLRECEDCRAHYEFVRAVSDASTRAPLPEPPESYWDQLSSKVVARLAREEPRGFWQALFAPAALRFGAVAATLLVVIAVSISVFREKDAMEHPAAPMPAVEKPQEAPEPPRLARDEPLASASRVQNAPPEAEETRQNAVSPTSGGQPEELEGDIGASTAEAVVLDESVEAASVPAEPPPPAAPAAVEADVPERVLEEQEPESPNAAAFAGRRSAQRVVASTSDCDRWREYLQRDVKSSSANELRYELARCSIRLFEAQPSEETRESALRDANDFLAVESEGPRAEEIRDAAARLRR